MSLKGISFKTSYHKGIDNIADEFYLPCMSKAIQYDRAVGFFRSSVYILAWPSLKEFVKRKGKIRIICSYVMSEEDMEAVFEGYNNRQQRFENDTLTEINNMFSDPSLQKPARVLATLVSMGVIDVKIAFLSETSELAKKRLFHDKLGIFKDDEGNGVVFKGSMNESWSGLSSDGNLESVDVFLSWEHQREYQRVDNEIKYFESLWSNKYPQLIVREFPEIPKDELLKYSNVKNYETLIDDICTEISKSKRISSSGDKRVLRKHQRDALEAWFANGRKGIIKHSTGSGKTFIAISAIKDALSRNEIVLIIVPSQLLFSQWHEEISSVLKEYDPQILKCGNGHNHWRTKNLLKFWSRKIESSGKRIILSTIQTASSDQFINLIQQGDHLFLVADEVHRLGSCNNRSILSIGTGSRLGLSATPERSGDTEGTNILLDYFGGILDSQFTIKSGIDVGVLCPYFYFVHLTGLSVSEQIEWFEFSKKISKLAAMLQQNNDHENIASSLQNLLISRSRIAKKASNKVYIASKLIKENYRSGQKWLVYCDDNSQLTLVLEAINQSGIPANEYHSAMEGSQENTIKLFSSQGGILVSIRCLDEGVNIPEITHALILASSRNPREFIQRRGRILRKSAGKNLAHIHDVLVLPPESENGTVDVSFLRGELARAIEFSKYAENPSSVTELNRIIIKLGLENDIDVMEGFEYDEHMG